MKNNISDSGGGQKRDKSKTIGLLKNALKVFIVAILIYFVFNQLSANWDNVLNYSWKLQPILLIMSIFLHLFTFILFSKVWCILMSALGHDVKLIHAFKISYIANLGRYIPGKIWPVFGMVYLAKQLGIREEKSVTSWALAMIFSLPSAFLTSAVCILISPEILSNELQGHLGLWFYLFLSIIFIISISLILLPNQTLSLFNWFLKLLKRPPINFKMKITTALLVYFSYSICWLSYGFSFWLFISSITSGANIPVFPAIASFVLAYQIGYLAIFAPGGVGIRELVLTVILAPYLGPISSGVAVAARVWNIIIEVTSALIAWTIKLPQKSDS
ncbi:MAG: lysylphosphatidylglycerol synthase transmembrane domain-containing protein [Candidatus Zixiibacteriota bacterium]